MKDAFEKLFRAVHQFKKLNVSDLIPGLSSSEFSVMGAILQMGENGKITSSELAAKTKTLPPAVSRTLRGLEEKGYVERSVDKKDRRNTYISLTEKGWKKGEEVRDRMQDFGCSVMSQLKEEISWLLIWIVSMRSQKKKLTPENDRISVPASWYTKKDRKGKK